MALKTQFGRIKTWLTPRHNRLLLTTTIALILVLAVWGAFTPASILGKADAVGYAVCHRIEARSFLFPDRRQLPLCARCSGTFLGVLIGLFGPGLLLGRRKASGFPPLAILGVMITMSILWAFDGANSYMRLIPAENLPRLYTPSNFLRISTGIFHGITMGSLVLPIVNATVWVQPSHEETVARWWHLLILYITGGLVEIAVLSGLGVFLYPLAILSSIGVVAIMAAVLLVVLSAVIRYENFAETSKDLIPLVFLSVATAFIIIGGIDAIRYFAFGTWDGFVIIEQ